MHALGLILLIVSLMLGVVFAGLPRAARSSLYDKPPATATGRVMGDEQFAEFRPKMIERTDKVAKMAVSLFVVLAVAGLVMALLPT